MIVREPHTRGRGVTCYHTKKEKEFHDSMGFESQHNFIYLLMGGRPRKHVAWRNNNLVLH